jgi:pSer/pThr/pTyr-binding forkhead associated (FHA) protein
MARLVLCLDEHELAEYNMTKERYTIGRLPDNDIRLDHPGVSGHHALVINILDDSFLEDLNSTNGTSVNGRRISKHPLQHGDVVRIGKHALRFVDEQQEDMDADEFERTMVINSMNDAPARVEELVKQVVGGEVSRPAGLRNTGADLTASGAVPAGSRGTGTAGTEAAPLPTAPPPLPTAPTGASRTVAQAAAQALADDLDDSPDEGSRGTGAPHPIGADARLGSLDSASDKRRGSADASAGIRAAERAVGPRPAWAPEWDHSDSTAHPRLDANADGEPDDDATTHIPARMGSVRHDGGGFAAVAATASTLRAQQSRAPAVAVATEQTRPEGDPVLPRGKIQVLSGTFAGKELELQKALTTLGRPGVQVAAISRRAEGFYIVHVESGNPEDYPKLNGVPIGHQAHELGDRDVIELAGVKMGFFRV